MLFNKFSNGKRFCVVRYSYGTSAEISLFNVASLGKIAIKFYIQNIACMALVAELLLSATLFLFFFGTATSIQLRGNLNVTQIVGLLKKRSFFPHRLLLHFPLWWVMTLENSETTGITLHCYVHSEVELQLQICLLPELNRFKKFNKENDVHLCFITELNLFWRVLMIRVL